MVDAHMALCMYDHGWRCLHTNMNTVLFPLLPMEKAEMSPRIHEANNRQHCMVDAHMALCMYDHGWRYLHTNMNTVRYSHVHIRSPRSGVHIPLDAQVAVILIDGTNIWLHLNEISAPSVVF